MNRIIRLAAALPFLLVAAASAGDLEDGKALQQAGKFEEALPKYEAAAKADPANVDAALGLSQVLAGLGRYEEAAKAVDAARKANPGNASLLAAKGRAYLLQCIQAEKAEEPDGNLIEGLKADALRWAKEAMKADAKNVDALILLGQVHQKNGDDDQARTSFEQAVAADGKSFDAQYALANALFVQAGKNNKNMELWAKAESAFFQATRLDPKSAAAALNYAHCKAWQNEPGKEVALAYFKAAELMPDDETPLARAYPRMPKADRPAAYKTLADSLPKNVTRKLFLAYALKDVGKFEDAVAVIEEAAKIEPKNGYVPLTEGEIRLAWGKNDDAVDNFAEAAGLFGKDIKPDVAKKLGYTIGMSGKTLTVDQKEKLWAAMWKSCPEGVVQSGLWSDVGLFYRDGTKPSNPQRAMEWYLRAVGAAPEDATILNDTGVIFDYNLHQPEKGEPYYRKAVAVGKREGYGWNDSTPPGIGFRDSLNNLAKLLVAQKRWKDLKEYAENDVPQDDPSRAVWIKEAEEKMK